MENQRQLIYQYLRQNKTITQKDANDKLGITKLSTRIGEMVKWDHIEISREMIEVKNRRGNKTRVMMYWLTNGV